MEYNAQPTSWRGQLEANQAQAALVARLRPTAEQRLTEQEAQLEKEILQLEAKRMDQTASFERRRQLSQEITTLKRKLMASNNHTAHQALAAIDQQISQAKLHLEQLRKRRAELVEQHREANEVHHGLKQQYTEALAAAAEHNGPLDHQERTIRLGLRQLRAKREELREQRRLLQKKCKEISEQSAFLNQGTQQPWAGVLTTWTEEELNAIGGNS